MPSDYQGFSAYRPLDHDKGQAVSPDLWTYTPGRPDVVIMSRSPEPKPWHIEDRISTTPSAS